MFWLKVTCSRLVVTGLPFWLDRVGKAAYMVAAEGRVRVKMYR